MSKILLTQEGTSVNVDNDVYEWASQSKWHVIGKGYVARLNNATEKWEYLHRLIMNTPDDQEVDHRNHDPFDCRRDNLRNCTHQQNQQSHRKPNVVHGASPFSHYKGVSWHIKGEKWRARIKTNGHEYSLGLYTEEIDAAMTYDEAAKELFGEFAVTNF